MKKSKILLVALCALPLASCGQSESVMDKLSSGSILTKEIILQNLSKEDHLVSVKDIALPEGTVKTSSNAKSFLFIEKDDNISLFNVLTGTVVAENLKSSTVNVTDSGMYGRYIRVEQKGEEEDESNYLFVSQNGKIIHSCAKEKYDGFDVTRDESRKVDVISFEGENLMYEFDGTTAKVVTELPASNLEYSSMEEYGYKEYSVAYDYVSNQIKVKKGDKVKTYKMPYNAYESFDVSGKYFMYLNNYTMSDDSKDYQYIFEGTKYKQVIGLFDYTKGTFKETVLDYYISEFYDLKDADGFTTLRYAQVASINKDKTLNEGTLSWYLMDSKLKLYDDVTPFVGGGSIFGTTKVIEEGKNTYYQVQNDTSVNIYNSKLELVDSLYGENTAVAGVIITRNNANRFGLINYKGETIAPCKYTYIYKTMAGKTIAEDGDKAFYVNFGLSSSDYAETEIVDYSSVTKIADGYMLTTYNEESEKANVVFNNIKSEALYQIEDVTGGNTNLASFTDEIVDKKYNVAKYTLGDNTVKYGLLEFDIYNYYF